MSRKNQRYNNSPFGDIIKVIIALALVIIAVIMVYFLYAYIRGSFSLFSNEEETAETFESSEIVSEETSEIQKDGFNVDENGMIYYMQNDIRYQNEWLVLDNKIYSFDSDGFLRTSDFSSGGMKYKVDSHGAVIDITYDSGFVPDPKTENKAFFSLVMDKGSGVWIFLNEDKKTEHFYAVMYKYPTETSSHYLGGNMNIQYASEYAIDIDDGYIYYSGFTQNPEKKEERINRKLYRMKPDSKERQIVAEDVDGFKVIDKTVYFSSGGVIKSATKFVVDETARDFPEDGEYEVDIDSEEGKAFLVTKEDHFPVMLENDGFKSGNFIYSLSEEGEILGVKEKESVSYGGYIYKIESDSAFNTNVSRMIKEDSEGKVSVISSEFVGKTYNIHYNEFDDRMYAEYTDESGTSKILRMSFDGNADSVVSEMFGANEKAEIIGFDESLIIVRFSSNERIRYKKISTGDLVPVAIGVEEAEINEDENDSARKTTSPEKGKSQNDNLKLSDAPVISGEKQKQYTLSNPSDTKTEISNSEFDDKTVISPGPGQ